MTQTRKAEVHISAARTGSDEDPPVFITIKDASSKVRVLELEIPAGGFLRAIAGRTLSDVTAKWSDKLHLVGGRRVTYTKWFKESPTGYYTDTEAHRAYMDAQFEELKVKLREDHPEGTRFTYTYADTHNSHKRGTLPDGTCGYASLVVALEPPQ